MPELIESENVYTCVTDQAIIEAMKLYGGDFHRALADAAERADATNLLRIKSTFSDDWSHFAELAARASREVTPQN